MKKIINRFIIILLLTFPSFDYLMANENVLSIGSGNSKVVVRVFSSLTCPHCANFHNKIFESLKKEYIDTKKIKFEHHGFPLDLAALNAERILRSIENKEKSFEFLGIIYKKQNQWAVGSDINKINDYIKKIGIEFGLNAERMNKFLIDDKIQDQILNERIEAQKKYSISSTPTIYVNEKKYKGKHEYKLFKKFLEKSL
jgi:protein-disulfide isomerase|tara:strand:+ start:399 stop:995 length:597 start_codon:yes stop_codon:yes gene_type:complete